MTRMLEDKDMFEERIQLIISDNCSEDDLKSCCEKYQKQGLKLQYHRNETNIGPDGNFEWCFHHSDGQYVWLLGSDDIPVKGLLREVLSLLENSDYGLLHLSIRPRKEKFKRYHNDQTILVDINVWITFISSNIIRTDTIKAFDLSEFVGSYLIQVPAYLNGCLSAEDNVIAYLGKLFEDCSDSANSGGYNLFRVFVENLFGMYQHFIDKGKMSQEVFELVKEHEYKMWLVGYVVDLLILKRAKRKNFKLDNAWGILYMHYGGYSYFYYTTLIRAFKSAIITVARLVYHFVKRI